MNMKKIVLHDNCIVCWDKFTWEEQILIKCPEWVCFHLDCAEKFPDNKIYNIQKECWITTPYYPWLIVEKT